MQSALQPWHDFYALVGTASATLVGLMFVAASVGTGVFTQDRQAALRGFLSPTVVAFSTVLATSLISVVPVANMHIPGGMLIGTGALGIFYSWLVWRMMVHDGLAANLDMEDRAWYLIVPAIAYLILGTAGIALAIRAEAATTILAIGTCLLLVAGIRNGWDITTWVVMRRRDATPPERRV